MPDHEFDQYEFAPSSPGPTALFLDTSAFVSYFDPDAAEHDVTTTFVESLLREQSRFPYRPLFTNTYVVDEIVAALLSRWGHSLAADALQRVVALAEDGALRILPETQEAFTAARDAFYAYDDHDISFTDHLVAVQARRRDVDHVLAFDDDFRALGLEVLPRSS